MQSLACQRTCDTPPTPPHTAPHQMAACAVLCARSRGQQTQQCDHVMSADAHARVQKQEVQMSSQVYLAPEAWQTDKYSASGQTKDEEGYHTHTHTNQHHVGMCLCQLALQMLHSCLSFSLLLLEAAHLHQQLADFVFSLIYLEVKPCDCSCDLASVCVSARVNVRACVNMRAYV